MAVYQRFAISCLAACSLLTTAELKADCCAGHRADFLVGYRVHVGPSRATPFAGTVNPRYANEGYAARSIGGPVAMPGPTDFLVRKAALEQAAQYEAAQYAQQTAGMPYASDVELMDSPASEADTSTDTPVEGWSPEYPGQQAATHVVEKETSARVSESRTSQESRRVASANSTSTRRRSTTQRTNKVGAYGSSAAMQLANSLQRAGLGG